MLNWQNDSAINTTDLAPQLSIVYCRRFQDEKFFMVNYVVTLVSTILNALSCPVIIAMNMLVLVAVKTRHRLQSSYNILLACLAGSDLLVGTVTLPVFIGLESFIIVGLPVDAYCKLHKQAVVAFLFPIFASLYNLVLVSVERYIVLKYALRYHEIVTKRRLATAVVLSVVLSCLVAFFYTLARDVYPSASRFFVTVLLLFSTLTIAYCHLAVFFVTRRHKKQILAEQISREAVEKFLKEKKAWKTTSIIIGFVILSYLPAIAFLSWRVSGFYVQVALALQPFAYCIMLLNSLCNPLIYCWRCKDIRKAMTALIKRQNLNET